MSTYQIPQEKQRTGNFPYKFKITEGYVYADTSLTLDEEFENR